MHLLGVASFAIIIGLAPSAHAQRAGPKPRSRAEAVEIIRNLRHIVAPNGIERDETIRIGGIEQFVTIRGVDRRNPILLILHGGPGFVEAPIAWWNTRELEEYFTVVEWDQRGAGKTYLINDPKVVAPTMTTDRMIADTEELISRLRSSLGKRKIFLLGHSWGSYLGLEVAKRHPDWLYAYIGTGQATDIRKSERRGYDYALAAAKKAGNAEAISELQSIAPYAAPGRPIPLKSIMIERKWSDFYGGVMAYRTDQIDGEAAALSPDYSDAESAHVYDGNDYSEKFFLGALLNLDVSGIRELKCPLILLEGRHDRTVNSVVAFEWFKKVHSPSKRFVWFEHSAHEVMTEEPGKVLMSLVRYARPLAEKAGDVAH
jgi:pimeloyl-ACP methyl ester carboxylesterase